MALRLILRTILFLSLAAISAAAQAPQAQPLRVFLRAGPKTHGPGEHDHPRFLEEWKVLLAERGAVVEGALRFPTAEELSRTDVLVMYAAEGGSVPDEQRRVLADYLARGGGIVALHDAVCGTDPQWFKTIIGGAWEHGHSKWEIGEQGLYFTDEQSPITAGAANFDLVDEIYYDLHLMPEARVLATSFRTVFDVEPQLWTYEKDDYRAFVSIQGHYHKTFSNPAWRALLLRGIAWAGKADVDALITEEEARGLSYPPGGPTAPELAAASFELAPGFEISLAAAEPLVENPISIDWDPSGRMWVANTPGYPLKQESSGLPAHDSVVVLSDADGDGRMDSRRVFAEGLDLVTSLVFHGDGVIVTQAPDILWLRDRDGDGAADEREVLFTGFGYGDTHAVMSNLRWGMDGWVYATQGYSGGASRDIRNAAGKSFGAIGNGLFRFRPDGSAIEVVSSYGSNTWGLDFDPSGELFYTMANGSHLRHVVLPESDLGGGRVGGVNSWTHIPDHREVRPLVNHARAVYQQIDFVGGFTAAAGSLIYDGGTFPAEFQGDHFVCEPTVSLVHRDRIEPRGVTYSAHKPREAEFLASSDLWFRPVHVRTGPDGALYVLDFYNQAAVHNDTRGPEHGPQNAALRPDRDATHGRIWRVQSVGAPALAGRVASDEPDSWIAALSSANSWQRETAARLLRARLASGDERLADLVRGAFDAGSSAARCATLWLSALASGPAHAELLRRALDDEDAGVRRNAAKVAAEAPLDAELERLLWEHATTDADARCRLLSIVALAGEPLAPDTSAALVRGYGELEDDWSRTASLRALSSQGAAALSTALAEDSPALARELAGRLGRRADGGEVDRFIAGCASVQGPALAGALRALQANLPGDFSPKTSEDARASLRALLGSEDLQLLVTTLALCQRLDSTGSLTEARSAVGGRLLARIDDPEVDFDTALGCLEALLSVPDAREQALERAPEFLLASAPLDVQLRAIEVLAGSAGRDAGATLAAALPAMSSQARSAALPVLLERDSWAAALLDEVQAERVRPIDLGPRSVHALKNHPTAALAQRAVALLDSGADPNIETLVAELLPKVSSGGDPVRGEALFAEHCGVCHTFDGKGANVGPVLTGMGAHGVETLLPLILDPNREVDPAYIEYVVRRTDGRSETGLIVRETAESVVLRNTDGDSEVPRSQIAELRSSGLSLMPTGLQSIGTEQLRDVLAYICDAYQGYRILDLTAYMNANSAAGMYDGARDSTGYRFARTGVVEVEGVPFQLMDPARPASGFNVLVLKGGPYGDWRCKRDLAQRVEIPLEGEVGSVHVLGGVAGWGYPFGDGEGEPIVRWTFEYEDGTSETTVLHNAVEFADWIGRYDVPGSRLVEGLVASNSYGQLRTFEVRPARSGALRSLVLESFDNHLAPTFMGLTVESVEKTAQRDAASPEQASAPVDVLIFGGGSSHDFGRWFREADLETLARSRPDLSTRYTERAADLASGLGPGTVLVLCTNQPIAAPTRERIEQHLRAGGSLLAYHPGTWRNWASWESLSRDWLGGASESHEPLREFDVELNDAGWSWLAPRESSTQQRFPIVDELYRFAPEEGAVAMQVLAEGVSRDGGARYPVLWTTRPGPARVVGLTLGHDGDAHGDLMFQRLLLRAIDWLRQED